MKKNLLSLLLAVFLPSFLILQISCSKKDVLETTVKQNVNQKNGIASNAASSTKDVIKDVSVPPSNGARGAILPSNSKEKPLAAVRSEQAKPSSGSISTLSTSTYGIGSSLSDTYYGSGYYRYPDYTLDFTSTQHGFVITIDVSSYDIPNRFEIYDPNGNLIVSSGWMGYANYQGPWGSSLNTPQNKTLRFIKSTSTYSFRVETSTQDYSDAWNANINTEGSFDSKFSNIGTFHNGHLTNANNNFSASSTGSYEGNINVVRDFNKSHYIANEVAYFGSALPTSTTDQEFEKRKYFADYNYFKQILLTPSDTNSLSSTMSKVNSLSIIDASNKQLFQNISSYIESNLNGYTSNSAFESYVINLTNNWLEINYGNEHTIGAKLTGTVLAIGLKSCEWWRQNPGALYDPNASSMYKSPSEDSLLFIALEANKENYTNSAFYIPTSLNICLAGTIIAVNKSLYKSLMLYTVSELNPEALNNAPFYIPPPIAADIAGAFVGAIGSAVVQYSVNGSVNMRGVYASAGVAAVTGSTGLVGRVAGFISNLF